jgi:hypothetical protein
MRKSDEDDWMGKGEKRVMIVSVEIINVRASYDGKEEW